MRDIPEDRSLLLSVFLLCCICFAGAAVKADGIEFEATFDPAGATNGAVAGGVSSSLLDKSSSAPNTVLGGMAVMFGRPDWQIGFKYWESLNDSACTQQVDRIVERLGKPNSRSR